MQSRASLFEELTKYSAPDVETRGENAFNVGVRFIKLLETSAPDDKTFDLMMKAWFRAVKDNDYSKFTRTYRKYIDTQK